MARSIEYLQAEEQRLEEALARARGGQFMRDPTLPCQLRRDLARVRRLLRRAQDSRGNAGVHGGSFPPPSPSAIRSW
jgi:hypothetical protein